MSNITYTCQFSWLSLITYQQYRLKKIISFSLLKKPSLLYHRLMETALIIKLVVVCTLCLALGLYCYLYR